MEEMRNTRSVSSVTLANQYRLSQKPKRPEMKKITRKKKTADKEEEIIVPTNRHDSTASNYSWLLNDDDDGFDFDAEDDGFFDAAPDDGTQPHQIYTQACARLNVRPVRCIYDALKEQCTRVPCKNLIMKHNDVQACTIALVGATNIETIDFEGNFIGSEGGVYFGDVLAKNKYLTDIRIAYNNLGSPEAKSICHALMKNMRVKKLDLTGNRFNEHDAIYFKELLEENSAIRVLYLGHNYFRELGGKQIADGLASNDFLEELDLSWNHLRLKGAAAIGEALMKNNGLIRLDISWNGFHSQGSTTLAKALEVNQCLINLDLSCNRLSEACVAQLLKGLQRNTTLKNIRIGKNCISAKGATSILEYIKKNPEMGLEYIDMADQTVEEDFLKLLEEINDIRPLKVDHGGVWSNERDPIGKQKQNVYRVLKGKALRAGELNHFQSECWPYYYKLNNCIQNETGPRDPSEYEMALLNENPLYVLIEMMKVLEFRLVDLFHVLDKDNSKSISTDEFQDGLEAVRIPLKRKSLVKFVKMIDADKSGEIEYLELVEANRQYKEKIKQYVRDGTPIENTDIGRISKLVKKIVRENEILRAEKFSTDTGATQSSTIPPT